jgi:hypothetical protein
MQPIDLKRSIIQIKDAQGVIRGTGFIINNQVAVTCAHVVTAAGVEPGGSVHATFAHTGETRQLLVLSEAWRPAETDDIAMLQLVDGVPEGVVSINFGPSENTGNHSFNAFGYPKLGDIQGMWAQGTILGATTDGHGTPILQIRAQEIVEGMSGAPIFDTTLGRVIGMVTSAYYPGNTPKMRDVAFATPAEAILAVYPGLEMLPLTTPAIDPDSSSHILRSAINQSPPLPHHFIPRPEIMDPLKQELVEGNFHPVGGMKVSAIQGLGGIGKSTIAAALAYDPEVQTYFSDGILWTTLGQQPDLLFILSHWLQAVGDYEFRPASVAEATVHLRHELAQKSILLIIDDIWDAAHLRPLQICGPNGHIVLTTRRHDVVEEAGARLHVMEVMSPAQTLQLLAARLNRPISDEERGDALRLAESVGFLPLALELAAARVARGTSWATMRRALSEEVAQLETLEMPRRRKRVQSKLEASFHLSLKALHEDEEETRQAFIWLGVLPEGVQVTPPMVAAICQLTEARAAETLEILWNDALLLPGPTVWINDREWPSYRLHSLQRDIARRLLTTPPPNGLGLNMPAIHSIVLERYRQLTRHDQWHTLPNDGYIHAFLTWHMQQAGQIEQIHTLLAEETEAGQNGWYCAREQLGQTVGFLADVNLAMQEISRPTNNLPPSTVISLQIRYLLLMASLNSVARKLPLPLLQALVSQQTWTPEQGLAYARQMLNLEQQVKSMVELSVFQPEPRQHSTLTKAMEKAYSVSDPWEKTELLLWLSERLAELGQATFALIAAQAIDNENWQAKALIKIIPHLPEEMMTQALTAARLIDEAEYQMEVMVELIPHLSPGMQAEVLDETVALAEEVLDEELLAESLARLAPHLPQNLFGHILEIVSDFEWEGPRAEALAEIVPYLPSQLQESVLQDIVASIKNIRADEQRSQILLKVTPLLPKKLLTKAVAIAWKIKSQKTRAKTLARICTQLSADHQEKALQEVMSIVAGTIDVMAKSELVAHLIPSLPTSYQRILVEEVVALAKKSTLDWQKSEMLEGVFAQMPAELLDSALEITGTIQDQEFRTALLIKLATRLAEVNRPLDALTTARAITNDWRRAKTLAHLALLLENELQKVAVAEAHQAALAVANDVEQAAALAGLAPQLAQMGFLTEAMAIIEEIWYEKWRVKALANVAPYLSKAQLSQALTFTQTIRDQEHRVEALVGLAPHLSGPLLTQALKNAQSIQDQQKRAVTLLKLAPHLPEHMRQMALQGLLTVIEISYAKSDQLEILGPMLVHLSPAQQEKVTRVLWQQAGDTVKQVEVIAQIAEYLPKDHLPAVLAVVAAIQSNDEEKVEALLSLLPHLPAALLSQAMEITMSIQEITARVVAMSGIAPFLPKDLQPQLLASIQTIEDESLRGKALAGQIPYLPENMLAAAMQTIQGILDEWRRVDALAAIAIRLAQFGAYKQALEAVHAIWDDVKRAIILARLFPHLPAPLNTSVLRDALATYRCIWYAKWRAEVMAELAPYLPQELRNQMFEELLSVVATVTNERKQVEALAYVIPQLPTSLLRKMLPIVQAIKDSQRQSNLLTLIIPCASEKLHPELLTVVRAIARLDTRATLLGMLLPHVSDHMFGERLQEALDAVRGAHYQAAPTQVLAKLVPIFTQLTPTQMQLLWKMLLPILAQRQRPELLTDLLALEPIITTLGSSQNLADTSQAIQDVGRWWS